MIGHREVTTVGVIEDDVASLLAVKDEPEFPEHLDRVAAGDDR